MIARSRIADVTKKRGRRGGELTFIELETEFRNAEGALVARSRTKAVQTEKAPTEHVA